MPAPGTQSIPSITLTVIMLWLIRGLNPINCCNELFINHFGTTTSDMSILEGDRMEVNCTLFTSSMDLADGRKVPINSRMLFFKYNGSRISNDKLEIVDDLTIRYKVEQTSTTENGYYMCYLDIGMTNVKPKAVCATYITIARPPSPNDNFNVKCSGFDLKNFTCSWDLQDYNIATSYDLSIILAGDLVYSTCPKRNGKNSCTFSTLDKSPYLISDKKLKFRLDVSNKFGSIKRTFDIDHYSNVVLGPMDSVYPVDIGPDFVLLNWDPPRSIAHDTYLNELTEYQLKIYPVERDRDETSSSDGILYDDVIQAKYGKSITIREVRQYNVTSLIPFTRYSIGIRCRLVTAEGEGKWNEEILGNVETKPELPYLYPVLHSGEIELIQRNGNQLDAVIYFSKVDKMHTNGPDFTYILKIRPIQINMSIPVTLTNDTSNDLQTSRPHSTLSVRDVPPETIPSPSDLLSFQSNPCKLSLGTIAQEPTLFVQYLTDLESSSCTIENLNRSFDYEIEMMSHNSIGTSVDSSSIIVPARVYNQIHSGVDSFYAINWNGNNFTLYWTVSSVEMVSHYTIVWCETVNDGSQCDPNINMNHVDVAPNQTSVELTINLDRVEFGISVIDRSYGLSSGIKWASCIESGSLISVKNRFKRFNIISDGSNSIRVAWKLDCPALDHFIDHYEIHFCRIDHPCDRTLTTIDVANLSTEYTIENLNSNTGYNVTIRGVTLRGEELESPTITIETKVNVISYTLMMIIIVTGIVSLFLMMYTLAMCTLRRRKDEKKLKESVDSNWIPKMPPRLKGDANILLNPLSQEIRNEYENKEYMNSDSTTNMNKLNSVLGSFDQQLTKEGNVIILSTLSGNNRLYDIIPCSLSSSSFSSTTEEPDEGLELTSSLNNRVNSSNRNHLIKSFSSVSSTSTKKQRSRRLSDGGGCDSEDSGYSTKLSDKNVYYKSDAFTIDGLMGSIDGNSSYIVVPEAKSKVTPVEILMDPSNDYVVNNKYVSMNQSLSDSDCSCNDQTGITMKDDYQTSPSDYAPFEPENEAENVNMTSNGYVYA